MVDDYDQPMKTAAYLSLLLLLTAPALGQPINSSSLGNSTFSQTSQPTNTNEGVKRALWRYLQRDLAAEELHPASQRLRYLGLGWPRLSGAKQAIADNARMQKKPIAYSLSADPLYGCLGVNLAHRKGWHAIVEYDVDDRAVVLGVEGSRRTNYELSYEQETGALQAVVTLPF